MNWKRSIKHFLDNLIPLQPISTGITPQIKIDPALKAVVFDIYGTLLISASGDIDQADLSAAHLHRALTATSRDCPDDPKLLGNILSAFAEEIARQHESLRSEFPYPEVDIVNVWAAVFQKFDSEISFPEDMKSFAFIFELLCNNVWPMPMMAETIEFLHRRKTPMGIVSNAQFYTPMVMNWFLTRELTESTLVSGFCPNLQIYSYLEKRAKPDEALFEKLAESLEKHYSLTPEQSLYVGNDMLKDIRPAQVVGFKTALFAGDRRSLRMRDNDARLKGVEPNFIITELGQIRGILGESSGS